jgi:DNA-binding FrmR family transcriptional regulator
MIPATRESVRERLLLTKGHLEGVVKMVDGNQDDAQVLRQILAVHASLEKISVMVLEGMLETFMNAPKARRSLILGQIRESLRDLT